MQRQDPHFVSPLRLQRFRVERTGLEIYVASIRRVVDDRNVCAQSLKQLGSDIRRGSVRTIEHESDARERHAATISLARKSK